MGKGIQMKKERHVSVSPHFVSADVNRADDIALQTKNSAPENPMRRKNWGFFRGKRMKILAGRLQCVELTLEYIGRLYYLFLIYQYLSPIKPLSK